MCAQILLNYLIIPICNRVRLTLEIHKDAQRLLLHSYIEARVRKRIILVPWCGRRKSYGETETWVQVWSLPLTSSRPWTRHLIFLSLNFLICRIRFPFLSIKWDNVCKCLALSRYLTHACLLSFFPLPLANALPVAHCRVFLYISTCWQPLRPAGREGRHGLGRTMWEGGPLLCSLIALVIDPLGHKDASGKKDRKNICCQVG